MARRKKQVSEFLTETEMSVMKVLWENEPVDVPTVTALLKEEFDFAYNTVATMLKVLDQKDFVLAEKQGRSLVYSSKVSKAAYQGRGLKQLVSNLFGGESSSLVKHLVNTKQLSVKDLSELRDLITQQSKGQK